MGKMALISQVQDESLDVSIQEQITARVDEQIGQLPKLAQLTNDEVRGIIARYSSVLEGNFIYWMTATYLAVESEEAREIILENLAEEVRDSHPVMLRKFAIAADAFPSNVDALAVSSELTSVRLFLGELQGVQSLATMAFFESYIQRFMSYLAELAAMRGSAERVYTDVHGVCDIEHSQELFRAVSLEMSVHPMDAGTNFYEGIELLSALLDRIIQGSSRPAATGAPKDVHEPYRNVKAEVIAQFKQVAAEQGMQLAPLTDDLPLFDSGLDSLCFAIVVVRLEMSLGVDPFSTSDLSFPVTLGDFIGCYNNAPK